MTGQDHNKTLVILFSAFGSFLTVGLFASPWIIAQSFSRPDLMFQAVIIFGSVFLLACLFWATAFSMYKRKPMGRKLALVSALFVLPFLWPLGVYAWWFMHSQAAKEMYGVK